MRVLDAGHQYILDELDGGDGILLIFVKRRGAKYPGNANSHPGTTTQEVLRAVIDRNEYVNRQIPCAETESATELMKAALLLLELRAARRHGRFLDQKSVKKLLRAKKCKSCGHIGCSHRRKGIR
jgi:hypothetical protein